MKPLRRRLAWLVACPALATPVARSQTDIPIPDIPYTKFVAGIREAKPGEVRRIGVEGNPLP